MDRNISTFVFILLGWVTLACISQDRPDILTVDRAKRLLAQDTGKAWLRVSRSVNKEDIEIDNCEQGNFYSFDFINGSDSAYYIGKKSGCATSDPDTIKRWAWEIIGNVREQFQDSLKLIDKQGSVTYRFFRKLSARDLEWEYLEGEDLVRENFTWPF